MGLVTTAELLSFLDDVSIFLTFHHSRFVAPSDSDSVALAALPVLGTEKKVLGTKIASLGAAVAVVSR